MDTATVLQKLERREPLYLELPRVKCKRICGIEIEFGTCDDKAGYFFVESDRLPLMLPNGGELYLDGNHLEYAGPECSNHLAVVAFHEAGKVIVQAEKLAPHIYCNNTDWAGNTFGSHESYFTRAPRSEWRKLIPFLIARGIICGAGWIEEHGEFRITQRARHLVCAESECTTSNRGILNLRMEPLSRLTGWDRLHLICGDTNMSEVSVFLRIGMTNLVVEMMEQRALPDILYRYDFAPQDVLSISQNTHDWRLKGMILGPKDGLELLRLYLNRAKELFSHRDEVTDVTLIIWEDTLNKLESDPMQLWRRLDWVTKLFILREFSEQVDSDQDWLRAQDLEYHHLNPEEGLYYSLRQSGEMERIVSDTLIMRATLEPPEDTRAYARGKISQLLAERGGHQSLCANGWFHLSVVDANSRMEEGLRESMTPPFFTRRIDNPFETYATLVDEFKRELPKS